MKKYSFFLVIFLLKLNPIWGQDKDTSAVNSSEWFTLHRVNNKNQVMLRWMPGTANEWNLGITNGYVIQRKKINTSNNIVVETIDITIPGLKVTDSTETKWRDYWKPDSVYHKELFYLSVKPQNSTSSQSHDARTISSLEERYFFANILADQSFSASKLCGLGYTDETVQVGFKYDYIIKISGSTSQTVVTVPKVVFQALLTLSISEAKKVPKKLTLSWYTKDKVNQFSSYFVQRADTVNNDCSDFKTLNKLPLIVMSGDTMAYFSDSLPNKSRMYCYRLIGKSYFDEIRVGYSFKDSYRKFLENIPQIDAVTISGSNMKVDWQFNGLPDDISSFRIAVSKVDTAKRGQAVFKEFRTGIPAAARTLTFPSADIVSAISDTSSVYYVFVGAQAETGSSSIEYSHPYVISPKDKIPPSAPKFNPYGPVSASDLPLQPFEPLQVLPPTSDGKTLLKLRWTPSTDNIGGVGLLGYRVYRLFSNQPAHLKVEISGGIINRIDKVKGEPALAYVIDTVGTNYSYTKATYFVSALDSNYNESAVTTYVYTKPDTKRPNPPFINKIETVYKGKPSVKISYTLPEVVDEVITYKLISKENMLGSLWSDSILAQNSSFYLDTSVIKGKEYVYSILAIDQAGNQSCYKTPSLPGNLALHDSCYQMVKVKIPNVDLKPAISTFTAIYQEEEKRIKLNWAYAMPNVSYYEIYKGRIRSAPDTTKTALLEYVNAPQLEYSDINFDLGVAYRYQIRAVFTDGTVSAWKDVNTAQIIQKRLEANSSELNFSTKSEVKRITISANVPWTVSSSSAPWLSISPSSGSTNGTISISVLANTGAERFATLTLSGGGITREIRVNQLGVPNGTGLTASYFNHVGLATIEGKLPDIILLENPYIQNTDVSPRPGVSHDFVTVWEGYIQVKDSSSYTFYLSADDGFNFYLNGVLELSRTPHNVEIENPTRTFTLVPGINYPVKIEFWEDGGVGGFRFKWSNSSGLTKQFVPTTHLFPLFIPEPLSNDPLHNKCFSLQLPQVGKALQMMPNFLVQQQPLSNANDQIWKFEKVNSSYKIISQIDQQGKVIQVLGGGSNNADKVIVGYFNNANHQFWDVNYKHSNVYSLRQKGTSHAFIDIAYLTDQAVIFNHAEREFKFQPVGCPSTSNDVLLDKSFVSLGSLASQEEVQITTGLGWSVSVSDVWLQADKTGGYGNGVLKISAAPNTSSSKRQGQVKIVAGNTYYDIQVTQFAAPNGIGLDAHYFNVTSFNAMTTATPVLRRIDETVAFSWGGGSPGPGVNADFSARWEGFIEPPVTADYTFFVSSDDGCRLWINGDLIVNDNTPHAETEFRANKEIKMIAGQKYQIKLEFWDGGGGADAKLRWENNLNLPKQIVEKRFLYPSSLSVDKQSLTFFKNGGSQTVRLITEKPWTVNGGSNWISVNPSNGTQSTEVLITVGPLTSPSLRRENISFSSEGTVRTVQISQYPTSTNGLTASYFNVTSFNAMATAVPALKRIDDQVDFAWSGSPGVGVNNDFAARWEGYVSPPTTGNYRFFCASDDGVRLFVNGIQTIYDNNPHGEIEFTSDRTFYLEKDKLYLIRMEFWDSGSGAAARLRWSNDVGLGKQIIPKQFLYTVD
ncbi:MAG: PA14 domain-containing protein [Spirosomataceae bacterium]